MIIFLQIQSIKTSHLPFVEIHRFDFDLEVEYAALVLKCYRFVGDQSLQL